MPANILANPRKWKNKAILFKAETTYGTDPTPTGAANWIEARNVSLTPMDAEKVARNIELPTMGNSGDIIVGIWAKLSYDVAAAPSGIAGTAPKQGPLLMACGFAETLTATTSAAYNLISTGFGSATHYINIDGVLHKLLGGRGEVKFKLGAKGIPMFSYSFDAVYVTPATGAMPTIVRTGWTLEEGVNSVNTLALAINAIPLALSSLDWALGNKITRIDLPGPQREIVITDRSPSASVTVLAPDLAVFNPYSLAESGATVPVTTTHGSALGKKLKVDLQARIIGVEYDKVDEIVAYKLTLQPLPVAGNDEITLTFL